MLPSYFVEQEVEGVVFTRILILFLIVFRPFDFLTKPDDKHVRPVSADTDGTASGREGERLVGSGTDGEC